MVLNEKPDGHFGPEEGGMGGASLPPKGKPAPQGQVCPLEKKYRNVHERMGTTTKTFKPSFYTATLVFSVTVIVITIVLSGIMVNVPAARPHMMCFVPVIAAGGAVIVVMALLRIRAAEKAYVFSEEDEERSNTYLGCPDTYRPKGKGECAPSSVMMTIDETLVSGNGLSDRLRHGPVGDVINIQEVRTLPRGEFVSKYCGKAYTDIPWATHKALCPLSDIGP